MGTIIRSLCAYITCVGVREKITERLIAGTLEGIIYYSLFTIYVSVWAPGMQTGTYQWICSLITIIEQKSKYGTTGQESDEMANYLCA